MKRTMILLLVAAVVAVSAAPAGAKPPENRGKPGSGPTNPPACTVIDPLYEETTLPREGETLEGAREYTAFWILVTKDDLAERGNLDLCVEVTVVSGRLSDMNVALADYGGPAARRCGFYWPGGKINEGDVFNVGFSLDGYHEDPVDGKAFCGSEEYDEAGLSVLVMPQLHAKTAKAELLVTIGFGEVAP